ncbi:MAG TPA: hypothetical protein VK509_02250 [Polyangiales bacterium]|nr:hypothetical protein [Polyangiales bacterium]
MAPAAQTDPNLAPAPAAPAGQTPAQPGAAPVTPVPTELPAATPPAAEAAPAPTLSPAPVAPGTPAPSADEHQPQITTVPAVAERRPRPAGSGDAVEGDWAEDYAPELYLRLGFGFAFPFGSDVADVYEDRNASQLSFSGVGIATDWMGGIAVMPSLMLGLGVTMDTLTSGVVRNSDDEERSLNHSLYFAVIGGFADFYISPPAGFHLQALLGLSHLSRADDLSRNTANGFGAVLGAGYDFAVSRRWNLGVLGRVAVSSFSMDAVDGEEPSPTLYEPSLLWIATFRPET